MTRRRKSSSSSDSFWRMYEIGGADMALRYQQLRDAAKTESDAPPAPDAQMPPAASAAPEFRGDASDVPKLFGILQQQFEQAKPGLQSDRKEGLEEFMNRLGGLVQAGAKGPERTLDDMLAQRQTLDEMMAEFLPRVAKPTLAGAGPTSGTRGARLLANLQALKIYVGQAGMARGAGPGDAEAAMNLFARIARLTTRLHQAGADAAAQSRLEHDEARALAAEVFAFARRGHPMLMRPVWGVSNLASQPNAVFFSGPATTRAALQALCDARDLTLAPDVAVGADAATRRWRDLRGAQIAVFDLADAAPQVFYELGIALTLGTQLALLAPQGEDLPFDVAQEVFYELGIALTLGTQLALLAPQGETLPFDIAQEVHRYAGTRALSGPLDVAVDGALYSLQVANGTAEGSLAATRDHASILSQAAGAAGLHRIAFDSVAAAGDNAHRYLAALRSFNGMLGAQQHEVALSRWPGRYPDLLQPRWFAVMPFRPLQNRAHEALVPLLGMLRPEWIAVRGDQAAGQEVVRSIWDELCRASIVSVDLSGFNANVCLELGIAHTLGRPTLIFGVEGTERELQRRLPGAAKWRCHTYAESTGANLELAKALAALAPAPQSRRPR